MRRVLATVGLVLLAGAVALITVVAIFLNNVTGAPQPDGEVTDLSVDGAGLVRLAADASYEVGVTPDTDHPEYRGGQKLADPGCSVTDPAGAPVPLLDVADSPTLNPFTRYARFLTTDAGEYHVSCLEVSPVPATLVVRNDVWATERALAADRRARIMLIGTVGGLAFLVLGVGALLIAMGRRSATGVR